MYVMRREANRLCRKRCDDSVSSLLAMGGSSGVRGVAAVREKGENGNIGKLVSMPSAVHHRPKW